MPNDTEIAYKQRLNNQVDGWALDSGLYNNPYVYQWLCVEAQDAIRNANNYRPKIYAIPDAGAFPISPASGGTNPGEPAFSDYATQVRMLPGTIVLGMTLTYALYNAPGVYSALAFNAPGQMYINVTDDATGIPFFSDWISEALFNVPVLWQGAVPSPPFGSLSTYVAKTAWLPLTRPRPILSPGVITVEFSYKAGFNTTTQLILNCAEPCNVFRAQGECE